MNTNPPSLPVPRLELMQIGQFLAPRYDFSTKSQPEVKEALAEMYRGPSYDFDALRRRANLNPIRFTHTGAYACCGDSRSCTWAISEWDGIVRSLGVRTPILFYRYPYCIDCPSGCECESLYTGAPCYNCIRKKPCGEWMWGMGTVTSITNDLAAEDFRTPRTATTTLELRLEGAIRLATHRRWFYGRRVPITERCLTTAEAANRISVDSRLFVPPCGPPDCCPKNRFWPRNLDTILCADCLLDCDFSFDPLFWDSRYTWKVKNNDCQTIYVPGHVRPRVRVLMQGGGAVSVRNAVTNETISYPTVSGRVYSDTESDLVWFNNPSGNWELLPAALAVLKMEPGENVITTRNTDVVLGLTPYWIN